MNKKRSNQAYLIGIASCIFISSACLLILEIAASRLLAPYIGASLYTWTAIIGVILAGLSIGNWIGGYGAERGHADRNSAYALIACSLFTLGIPYLLIHTAEFLQTGNFTLLESSLIYVVVLFSIPALLLGIVTPLLTTMALDCSNFPGRIVGGMHALAALGSIVGTFAAGFWLIPWLGTRWVVFTTGVILGVLGLILLLSHRRNIRGYIALYLIFLGIASQLNGLTSPCDEESQYYCIRVIDESTEYGPARTLVLDHMVHSLNHEANPKLLITPYVHAMDELMQRHFEHTKNHQPTAFFAGGGAYTQPRAMLARYPEARIEVAEIDPVVTETATKQLYVDPRNLHVFHGDARTRLPKLELHSQDIIVTDVFHDVAVPWHLITKEYAALVKSRLKHNGLYLINIVDQFPNAKLVKSLIKTLQTEFRHVQVWLEQPPSEIARLTYVVSAGHRLQDPVLQSADGVNRIWFDFKQPVTQVGTPTSKLPLLTDDHAPVERLVSEFFHTNLGS